jgi:uncharacterized membrane protein
LAVPPLGFETAARLRAPGTPLDWPRRALAEVLLPRWLALANASTAAFLVLPFLAPLLLSRGHAEVANAIYSAYQITCHEWPFRAYFLFGPQVTYSLTDLQSLGVMDVFGFRGSPDLGYKVAFCGRNVAIYAGVLLAGLLYARVGRRGPGLSLGVYGLLILPMAIDGFTQLPGWRESTWELRTLTGLLFGFASVWLLYPRVDMLLDELGARESCRRPLDKLPA